MPTSPKITLFVDPLWVSPYVFSCYVALKEKDLDFEVQSIDLKTGEQRRPEFANASLTGRIPALKHGDFWLSESNAIVEYLDETFPERTQLMPTEIKQRARARQVMGFLRSDLLPLREARSSETVFYAEHAALTPLSNSAALSAKKLMQLTSQLVTGPETAFGSWCVADAELALMLQRLLKNGDPVPPPIAAYAERQWQRRSVSEFVARERPPYVPYT